MPYARHEKETSRLHQATCQLDRPKSGEKSFSPTVGRSQETRLEAKRKALRRKIHHPVHETPTQPNDLGHHVVTWDYRTLLFTSEYHSERVKI